jgi:hypothetical protein
MRRIAAIVIVLITSGVAHGQIVVQPKGIAKPKAIANGLGAGFFCVSAPGANVHNLGWLSANTTFRIEFESTSTSDPIAILASNRFAGANATGSEIMSSDDDGGALNPRFEVTKPYHATWVLSVSSADDDPACYTYRLTVVNVGS